MYAGFVGAASTLPYLLSLFAGALVDRWNHKRVLLISEIVAGVAVAGTPVALWLGVLTLPQLVVTAFVQGACSVFFSAAVSASERHGRPHQQRRSLLGEIAEGLAWTWRQPLARAAVSLVAVSNLVFQALVLSLIILVADGGGWCMRWSC